MARWYDGSKKHVYDARIPTAIKVFPFTFVGLILRFFSRDVPVVAPVQHVLQRPLPARGIMVRPAPAERVGRCGAGLPEQRLRRPPDPHEEQRRSRLR